MRKWEFLAVLLTVATLVGVPAGVFAYEAYRESQQPPGLAPHRAPNLLIPAGDVAAGRQVFADNCTVCHGPDARGGVGPDLRNVARGGSTFLYAFVLDPKMANNKATMPRVPLSEKEIADVVAFLIALPALPPEAVATPELAAEPTTAPAQDTVVTIDTSQSTAAPTTVPARDTAEAITVPQSTTAPTVAPPRDTAEAITAPRPTAARAQAPAPDTAQIVAQGKALFANKKCVVCHGEDGEGTAMAPALRSLTAATIRAQVRQPKEKMPPFSSVQLSDEELEAIVQYLGSLK